MDCRGHFSSGSFSVCMISCCTPGGNLHLAWHVEGAEKSLRSDWTIPRAAAFFLSQASCTHIQHQCDRLHRHMRFAPRCPHAGLRSRGTSSCGKDESDLPESRGADRSWCLEDAG